MNPLVSVLAVSSWEKAAAIGTIAGAVATLGAVVGALWLGKRDRDAASAAVQAQIDAQAAARREEHEVDLLLQIQRQIAVYLTHSNMPQQYEAVERGRGLLLALRDPSRLVATRAVFAPGEIAFSEMPRFDNGQPPPAQAVEAKARASREIADEIKRIVHG